MSLLLSLLLFLLLVPEPSVLARPAAPRLDVLTFHLLHTPPSRPAASMCPVLEASEHGLSSSVVGCRRRAKETGEGEGAAAGNCWVSVCNRNVGMFNAAGCVGSLSVNRMLGRGSTHLHREKYPSKQRPKVLTNGPLATSTDRESERRPSYVRLSSTQQRAKPAPLLTKYDTTIFSWAVGAWLQVECPSAAAYSERLPYSSECARSYTRSPPPSNHGEIKNKLVPFPRRSRLRVSVSFALVGGQSVKSKL